MHGALVIDDKMYIYGGNHNGRYLNDLQDQRTEASQTSGPHQKPLKLSARPPLIPNEDEQEKQKEGFIVSLGKLISSTGDSAVEIFGGIFPGLRKIHPYHQFPDQQEYRQEHKYSNTWPVQDSFVIQDKDAPTPRKTYPFMSQDV